MPRQTCPSCYFPSVACVCAQVTRVSHRIEVVVLQHPAERRVAKNTARLLGLSLQRYRCYCGESAADFAELQQEIQQELRQELQQQPRSTESSANQHLTTAVLYPSATAQATHALTQTHAIKRLILLDATWRKAYKMWQLNPWLQQLPTLTLAADRTSDYPRKAAHAQQLSTLEACAYALHDLEQLAPEPLLALQRQRMQALVKTE